MKKTALLMMKCLGFLSVITLYLSANTTCTWYNCQPEAPKDLKRFKKI
ncbi:cyclic lactone autoinducer peptide [Clostridioides sp. ZZV14-6154]|nr:cyclic lactone autoinducer peptide [Clostridioides sp. ZZV14-6154]